MQALPISPTAIVEQLEQVGRADWAESLRPALNDCLIKQPHGHWAGWCGAIHDLPVIEGVRLNVGPRVVGVSSEDALSVEQRDRLLTVMQSLKPWRKGPFELFGESLDAEWRCDKKWARLATEIGSLSGRRVLDVGAGNGWYSWQMRAAGASEVVAVDPTALFLAQFLLMQFYLRDPCMHFLPLPLEALPGPKLCFDTVFSMGVLYHRRNPLEHISQLRDQLRPGGELLLETLVVEGDVNTVLMPPGRYACMRNVWFLPSIAMLTRWLERLGFGKVRLLDCSVTDTSEQRVTEWSSGQSLQDFLDPKDSTRTLEGHPAPLRATLLAHR
jgi:tRNA (mo5U34)-methyltransferase